MQITVSLTVSECKRLIAKGVARHPLVQNALTEGMIAVAPGSTNAYVVEELTGESIDRTQFVTGKTLPTNYDGPAPKYKLPDLVLKQGERLEMKATEAVAEMGAGDVFVKGANAINYDLDQAGVLIGHPTGGTVGATLGTLVAKRILLLQPAGLEKSIPGDLHDTAAALTEAQDAQGPTLWITPGELLTEIEAFGLLCGAQAVPIGAGGLGGAEGAVWLALFGDKSALDRCNTLLDSVYGEPPFLG